MMGTLEGIEIKGFNRTANLEADLCKILSIMPANLKSLHWAILDLERASELNTFDPLDIDQDIPVFLRSLSGRWEALLNVTEALTNIVNITIAGWWVESNTPELSVNIQMGLNLEVIIEGLNKSHLRIISKHVNLLQLVQSNYQHTEISHLSNQEVVKLIQHKLQMTNPDKLAKAQESLKQKQQSQVQPEQAPEHVVAAQHLKTKALSPEVSKTTASKLAKAQEAAKQSQQAQTPKPPSHQAEKLEDNKLAKAQESVKQHQQTPIPAKLASDQTKPITQPVKEAPPHSPDSQRR